MLWKPSTWNNKSIRYAAGFLFLAIVASDYLLQAYTGLGQLTTSFPYLYFLFTAAIEISLARAWWNAEFLKDTGNTGRSLFIWLFVLTNGIGFGLECLFPASAIAFLVTALILDFFLLLYRYNNSFRGAVRSVVGRFKRVDQPPPVPVQAFEDRGFQLGNDLSHVAGQNNGPQHDGEMKSLANSNRAQVKTISNLSAGILKGRSPIHMSGATRIQPRVPDNAHLIVKRDDKSGIASNSELVFLDSVASNVTIELQNAVTIRFAAAVGNNLRIEVNNPVKITFAGTVGRDFCVHVLESGRADITFFKEQPNGFKKTGPGAKNVTVQANAHPLVKKAQYNNPYNGGQKRDDNGYKNDNNNDVNAAQDGRKGLGSMVPGAPGT